MRHVASRVGSANAKYSTSFKNGAKGAQTVSPHSLWPMFRLLEMLARATSEVETNYEKCWESQRDPSSHGVDHAVVGPGVVFSGKSDHYVEGSDQTCSNAKGYCRVPRSVWLHNDLMNMWFFFSSPYYFYYLCQVKLTDWLQLPADVLISYFAATNPES